MHLWQSHLDFNNSESTSYHAYSRTPLVDMFSSLRKFVLEIGCSSGATGIYCKEKHPEVKYWGIEPNKSSAELAKSNIDKVLVGLSDDFVLADEGVALGSIDGVILADVLEHMYNPWKTLMDLKPYLAPNAEIISSIPNTRNLWLLNQIASGHFTYQSEGLLDITHIRFFTWSEIVRMMEECGFEVNQMIYNLDRRVSENLEQLRPQCPCTINYEKLSLHNVTEAELLELCTIQYYSRSVLVNTA